MSSSQNPRPVLAEARTTGSAQASGLRDLRRFHLGLADAEASRIAKEYSPASLRALAGSRPQARAADASPGSSGDGSAALQLFLRAALRLAVPARASFRHEVQGLATGGRAMLEGAGDQVPAAGVTAATEQALGSLGSRFIDPASLNEILDRSGDRAGGEASSSEGLEEALRDLEPAADEHPPAAVLIHSGHPAVRGTGELEAGLGQDAEDLRIVEHEDPCAAAAETFDREAEALARTLRAVRRLRLETAGEFREELHGPWLEQLDWQGFSRDELHLLPRVVAVLSADQAAGPAMASLSRLLLSGRPVQVFVFQEPLSEAQPDRPSFRFEPAYFALSHREAWVQQAAGSWPEHMSEGFARALSATRAALHVVSVDRDGTRDVEGLAEAMLESRAHPLFRYDPEAGAGWAERCDLSCNPQPERDWPVHELVAERPGGGEEKLKLAVTVADLALLDPSWARHFAPVPEGVSDRHLVTVADYCARPASEETTEIPYLRALDGSSRLCRLAISRTLALACRDRLGFWRTLQELCGIGSGYVRRAAQEARQQAEEAAAAELARLRASSEAELERTRREASHQVVDQLTAALLDVDPATLTDPAAPLVASPALSAASVDELSEALLGLVEASTLDGEVAAVGPSADDGEVARVTSELLRLLG